MEKETQFYMNKRSTPQARIYKSLGEECDGLWDEAGVADL